MEKSRSALVWKYFAVATFAFFCCGCLMKDKSEKALHSGGMTPPWDSAHFAPKGLNNFTFADPESVFSVFAEIGLLDSLAGDHKDWKLDPEAVDTVQIGQVFDTAFAFPQNPEAAMPYAYDDSFRDDTLFRNAYGNGLFTQDHPCASTYVLSGHFVHPAKWLRTGLNEAEIMESLGTPRYHQPGVLRYLTKFPGKEPTVDPEDSLNVIADYSSFDIFEGVNFYFRNDSLFAAVLQRSQPCH